MPVRRLLSLVSQGALILVAITFALVLIVPKMIGWQVLTVLTGSMSPTYPAGGVVAIERVDVANVKNGDVIAFRPATGAVPITHRVTAIAMNKAGQREFFTKGDANEEADPRPVAAANVQGRVVFGAPFLGYAVQLIRSKLGFALLLLVPGLAFGRQQLRGLRAALRDEAAEAPGEVPGEVGDDRVGLQVLVVTLNITASTRRDVADLIALYQGELLEGDGSRYTVAFVAVPRRITEIEAHLARFDIAAAERSAFVSVPSLASRAAPGDPPVVRDDLVLGDDVFAGLILATSVPPSHVRAS